MDHGDAALFVDNEEKSPCSGSKLKKKRNATNNTLTD